MRVTAILLAAGQGTRMKSSLPKVLHPIAGKPMIWHALEAIKQSTTEKPVVVVGHGAENVTKYLGDRFTGTTIGDRSCSDASRVFAER